MNKKRSDYFYCEGKIAPEAIPEAIFTVYAFIVPKGYY
jgi:hypothetical protein